MREAVVAVEPNPSEPQDVHPTQPGGSRQSPAPGGRFTYPSGSRPLAGYTIKRGVGHGGFGEAYYATSDGGKEVALKLIRRNLDVELRGIRHCLNLKHPNLLAIFDIRADEHGDNWVIMEYVTGQSLQEAVAAHPNGMEADQALAWLQGIGAGVACLHDHGIVHRDLKPGNIFSDEGIVKVGDYGLSKYISCSRRSGHTESVGTVHYMAPEVANGRYGKEIDIYAMGIILYEMLTGRVPFEGESVGEVLMKHLTAAPDVSMLAEPYRSVVARALEKDPARRFGSVGEMLSRLPQPARPQVHAGPLPSDRPALGAAPAALRPGEEPVQAAVRRYVQRAFAAWNDSSLNTATKIVILLGVCALLSVAHSLLIPLAILLAVMYGCYWVIWAVFLGPSSAGTPGAPPTGPPPAVGPAGAPGAPAGAARASSLPRWYRPREKPETPAVALVVKSPRERLAELLGSMLGGSLVATIMALVMVLVASFHANTLAPLPQCVWLLLVGIAGTWAILIPAKFWEGSRGDPVLRRFVLMVIGLGVGCLAFGLATLLHVELPYDPKMTTLHVSLPANFYSAGGHPQLLAYLACFGTLFLLVRWWRQTDPLRRTRMSLWALFGSALAAMLVAMLWQFPQPWPIMLSAIISVSVQLASPWVPPRDRIARHRW